jgi:hypothetical protein
MVRCDWGCRHSELSIRQAEAISYGRVMCLNQRKINVLFTAYEAVIEVYGVVSWVSLVCKARLEVTRSPAVSRQILQQCNCTEIQILCLIKLDALLFNFFKIQACLLLRVYAFIFSVFPIYAPLSLKLWRCWWPHSSFFFPWLYSPWRTLAASHIGGFLNYLDIW